MKAVVSYAYVEYGKYGSSYGRCPAVFKGDKPTFKEIVEVEKELSSVNKCKSLVILNIIPLAEEESED